MGKPSFTLCEQVEKEAKTATYTLDVAPNLSLALERHATHEVEKGQRVERSAEQLV